MMADGPGVYQLHLRLSQAARVRVGKLGTFFFPAGRYVYTGSALGGLERRLSRHRRSEKKLHWHIDYLLCVAQIEEVTTWPASERRECEVNRSALEQPGARVIARGFGSSDCRCPTHLVYLGGADRPAGDAHERQQVRLPERQR
jgi:Uri superfamily endonuclease